jgi:4-hydroxy-3-polyprenylbenzoate decarboxylase
MMFNKYLFLTPATTNVRSTEEMAALMRNCDLSKSLIRSEGIYDVLDHATPTCGFGGKVALDLTNVELTERKVSFDLSTLPSDVEVSEDLLEKWSALLLFADNELEIEFAEVAKSAGCNYVIIFDKRAKELTAEELLWLGAANTEPSRDFTIQEGTLIIDARAKLPNGGSENPSRWPNIVTSDEATIRLVDEKWEKYGIGKFIPSPSKRYSKLQLCDGAQWHKKDA